MQGVSALMLVLLLAGTVLAGCLGDEDVAAGGDLGLDAEDARVTSSTGAIAGTVASGLFEPVSGATVTILETGRETRVARNGEFTINDVEPGSYILQVEAPGWLKGERRVSVNAGEVARVAFVLSPAGSDGPWFETLERTGMINSGMAITVEIPGMGCFYEPTPVYPIESCFKQRSAGSPGQAQNYEVTDDVKTVLVELVWDPAGPLGEHLFIDVACASMPYDERGNPSDPEHPCYHTPETTTSPVVHRIDESHWLEHDYNQTGVWLSRIAPNHGTLGTYDAAGVDASAAYQQPFTVYLSLYHKEGAPEGATGIPDR